MSQRIQQTEAVVLAMLVVMSIIVSVGLFSTPAAAAQSISNQRDIASHADSTSQQFSFSFDLPPTTITCTLKTDQMRQYGVTVKSVSVSGTNKLSMSVNSNGNVDMTIEQGSGSASATVTVTMSTEEVQIPDKKINHEADCGGGSGPSSASVNPIKTQATGFTIEETGIKDTAKTTIQSDDTTIQNDTTLTQSIDLDLVVPDDGDSDGDVYNVTIDTQEALAHGINVTGASLENDPSGANSQIEVVSTTVESDENVTIKIREASADHSNGNISRETITTALTLDGTQHDAGTFQADSSIAHVISDEAGNTTSTVTFSSTIPGSSNGSDDTSSSTNNPMNVQISAPATSPNSTVTVEFNFTNTNDTSLTGPALKVTDIPAGWNVTGHTDAGSTYSESSGSPTWLWLSVSAGASKTPTLTLQVPNGTAVGDYTIAANVTHSDFPTVRQTQTVTVSESGGKTINNAIAGSDGTIGITEIQQAIRYWANDQQVPNTGGKTIGIVKIQELIQQWASGS